MPKPKEELTPEEIRLKRAEDGLMNIEAEEELDRIIELNPRELTPEDRGYITARREYLNDRQLQVFQEVIDQTLAESQAKLEKEAIERGEIASEEAPKKK